jgi:hypothetical protein
MWQIEREVAHRQTWGDMQEDEHPWGDRCTSLRCMSFWELQGATSLGNHRQTHQQQFTAPTAQHNRTKILARNGYMIHVMLDNATFILTLCGDPMGILWWSYGDHMGIIWGSYGDLMDVITNKERMHICEQ